MRQTDDFSGKRTPGTHIRKKWFDLQRSVMEYRKMNSMMFYGGMVLAAAALVLGLISLCIYEVRKARLSAKLDAEYGLKEESKKK